MLLDTALDRISVNRGAWFTVREPSGVEPGDIEPGDIEPGDLDPGDLDPADRCDSTRGVIILLPGNFHVTWRMVRGPWCFRVQTAALYNEIKGLGTTARDRRPTASAALASALFLGNNSV